MSKPEIVAGDILLYRKGYLIGRAVQFGEVLEDGLHDRMYYHVGIALSDTFKIEADGKQVAVHQIDCSQSEIFDVYRLPVDKKAISNAIDFIVRMEGQKYDWWLIADNALRDLTGGQVHLPESFVAQKEIHEKICSTLALVYIARAGYKTKQINQMLKQHNSPEDVGLLLQGLMTGSNESV